MNNQKTIARTNTAITEIRDRVPARKNYSSTSDTKYHDQIADMTLETGRYALHALKENSGDYKTIEKDQNLSSVEKAMGKRKVLAADIGIGMGAVGGILGLLWLGKKVFTA